MDERQSFEAISDGLKKAAAAARQMAHHRKEENWLKISYMLEDVAKKSQMLYVASKQRQSGNGLIM